MMANATFSNTPGQPVDGAIDVPDVPIIGVGFYFPLGGVNWRMFWLVGKLFETQLKAGGIQARQGGDFGPNFICFLFTVPDRRSALPVLKNAAEMLRLDSAMQVAWWDDAELYWRTVVGESESSFDSFLEASQVEGMRCLSALLHLIKRRS